MCMSECISSVGEGYKNKRQAWMGAYQVLVKAKRTNVKQEQKETTMCMSGCISSVSEGIKNKRQARTKRIPPCVWMGAYRVWVRAIRTNDKREWMHIKCWWGQKGQASSKNEKETTMCMSGCISSVGEGYKNKRQAWMGAYQVSSVGEGKRNKRQAKRRPPCV